MIRRIAWYVRGSYPPAFYLPYAVCWALGVTALFALADPRVHGWHLDGGAVIAAITFAITLLTVRAMDDIKDLDYDRVQNPGRALPSGAVRVGDLVVLIAAGSVVSLALNVGRGIALAALTVQIGYAVLALVAERKLGWPSGDHLGWSALAGYPIQLTLNLYLYAGVLHQTGLRPSWHAVLPVLVASTAFLHLEYGRKLTRELRPGERSYVSVHGPTGTGVIGGLSAVASTGLALLLTRPWATDAQAAPWGWLVLIPLAFLGFGAYRFWVARATRWPVLAAALFLITSFLSYLVIGVAGKGVA